MKLETQRPCGQASPRTCSAERNCERTTALSEQTLWFGHNKGTKVRFPHSAQPIWNVRAGFSVLGWVCVVMRSPSFTLIEQAIQLLLGCRHDAESFLSAEHSVVGEMEDALAQAYAALGMARVFIFCSNDHVRIVRSVLSPAASCRSPQSFS